MKDALRAAGGWDERYRVLVFHKADEGDVTPVRRPAGIAIGAGVAGQPELGAGVEPFDVAMAREVLGGARWERELP